MILGFGFNDLFLWELTSFRTDFDKFQNQVSAVSGFDSFRCLPPPPPPPPGGGAGAAGAQRAGESTGVKRAAEEERGQL